MTGFRRTPEDLDRDLRERDAARAAEERRRRDALEERPTHLIQPGDEVKLNQLACVGGIRDTYGPRV